VDRQHQELNPTAHSPAPCGIQGPQPAADSATSTGPRLARVSAERITFGSASAAEGPALLTTGSAELEPRSPRVCASVALCPIFALTT